MNPNKLKESVRAGLIRSYFDGVRIWSKKSIHGLISPNGFKNSTNDTEIINMFVELEGEGLVKLIGKEDDFLEVLVPTAKLERPK